MRRVYILTIVGSLIMSVIGGCSKIDDKDELATWVKESLTENVAKDPDYAGLEVGEVFLMKESSHKFTGFVEYHCMEEVEKAALVVTVDGNRKMYKCEPPIKLIIQRRIF